MTFQIGMVGSDGIIIASDRRCCYPGCPYTDASLTDKITVVESKKLAYCCAGDQLCIAAAKRIVGQIDEQQGDLEIKSWFETCAVEVVKAERERQQSVGMQPGEIPPRGGSILLAYCKSVPPALWRIEIPVGPPPWAQKIENKNRIGDSSTPACFFSERYYRGRPVDELIFLAAHTVLTAGAMNPAGIGGLDVVLCKPSGFEVLPAERIAVLNAQSERLHLQISESLFTRSDSV
jgi:hypothetical protein